MPFPNLDGRPSGYDETMPLKIIEYIELSIKDKQVPTTAGLGLHIGINKDTIFEWRKKYEQFSDSYDLMMLFQENEVWQKALTGEYNSNISKLMLFNHGYTDKVETKNQNVNMDIDVLDATMEPEEELQRVLERIKKLQDDETKS